jgi:hypothetical protein
MVSTFIDKGLERFEAVGFKTVVRTAVKAFEEMGSTIRSVYFF